MKVKYDFLAIIPARWGSKGVPQKNIRLVHGRPLIAWTIDAALSSKYINKVIVSTDNEKIANIAKNYGAQVPFLRPSDLAGDATPMLDVLQNVVKELENTTNYTPDFIVTLQPTSPLRDSKDIDTAIKKILRANADSLVSVCPTKKHPFWMKKLIGSKAIPFIDTTNEYNRRQDLPMVYSLNGAIYISSHKLLMEYGKILSNDPICFIMEPEHSIDIDSEMDLLIAEALMTNYYGDNIIKSVDIGNRKVGSSNSCFIIAEAGVNHNGDIGLAKKLIDLAKIADVDAIKFQTFSADNLVTSYGSKASYQLETTDSNESQYDMLKKLELTKEEFKEIAQYAREKGLMFLSTPFDEESADLLEELDVPAYKIGSGDLTNLPLLEHIARKNKPMILSTGMATLNEVHQAMNIIRNNGNNDLILLHCTSNYPTKMHEANLKAMSTLRREFNVPVGYSDHTIGITIPLAAVAMEACIIEKHFTLNKKLPGPDHKASIEPSELKEMVNQIRILEKALGTGEKKPVESEILMRKVARRSIVAGENISKGKVIRKEMLLVKRPGHGLESKHIPKIVGKIAKKDIKKDELITWEMIE